MKNFKFLFLGIAIIGIPWIITFGVFLLLGYNSSFSQAILGILMIICYLSTFGGLGLIGVSIVMMIIEKIRVNCIEKKYGKIQNHATKMMNSEFYACPHCGYNQITLNDKSCSSCGQKLIVVK